jgi:hypothetical protein
MAAPRAGSQSHARRWFKFSRLANSLAIGVKEADQSGRSRPSARAAAGDDDDHDMAAYQARR